MKLPFSRRLHLAQQTDRPSPAADDPGTSDDDRTVVEVLAAQFLPEDVRDRWLALGRAGVQLVRARPDQAWVARLGGLPRLPDDRPWPEWPGHGPLSYIGEIDCARVEGLGLDVQFPPAGRLLFFYFDGSYDNFASTVGYWDASSALGAQSVFVPATADGILQRSAPAGVPVYKEAAFAGRPIVTFPGWEHPDLRATFMREGQDPREFMDHPVCASAFQEALHERHRGPLHQIGGYADPVQGPVEGEIAQAVLGGPPWGSEIALAEAACWELILQVDTDDSLDMVWGDCGALYWLGRKDDLARGDLSRLRFTWQCS